MAIPKKLPTVLTEDEQARLLEQPNPRYPIGEPNRTLLQLILNTGLRLAEVTALQWRDVDLTTGKLMARGGKGAKDRTLWIGEGNLAALVKWRERQVCECAGSPQNVFTTKEGGKLDPLDTSNGW